MIVSGISIFTIWTFLFPFLFQGDVFLEQLLNRIFGNIKPLLRIGAIMFFVSLAFVIMLKVCFIILGYDKSKKRFCKTDIISCVALCIMYFIICNCFLSEGGIIYLIPFSEKYAVTEDFPSNKRAILKSFLKLVVLNDKKEDFFYPEKQISYEDLLTMAAVSPAILSSGNLYYPKFYVRYWANEILYPLSDDLAQKDYWGRKLIVSSESIEAHFFHREWGMLREIFLASKYLSILKATATDDPGSAYRQWLRDKLPYYDPRFGRAQLPQMTSEEEKEWLYWYKILWPQLEHD